MKIIKTTIILNFLLILSIEAQSYFPEKKNDKIIAGPLVPIQAYSFHASRVKLLPGSPFKHAQDLDSAYLVSIDPYRLLHRFYVNAGLPTKGDIYGGWEKEGLSGHTLGHYLSACALMYINTGNSTFTKNISIIINELDICQQKRKTGYIGAIPNEDTIFAKVSRGDIKTTGFDLNGGWSPWYTVHKVMAGLVDAYLYTDNKKALDLVVKMADWTYNTINHLPDSSLQKMLRCEYGGMNEVLAQIYTFTGNKKYLDLSYKFYDDFVMKPLSQKIDPMPGKHSNTNVPKAIGSAVQYALTGNKSDLTIASFFWNTMVDHHTYVIGGNSSYEYCGDPDKLNDRLSDNTCETCNTYNMLKLTRHLFSYQPKSTFTDYYERALYNHILASQHPETGMMCYFVPLRMGTKKSFSDPFNTFTCCVGTGIENHSKYNEAIYSEGNDGSLYVNLFIPSVLDWKEKKSKFILNTKFPDSEIITLTIDSKKSSTYPIRIRKPYWCKEKIEITINGKTITSFEEKDGYIVLHRKWKNQDKIKIRMPMQIHYQSLPDNPNRIALLYGPLVLAGQLGTSSPDPVYGVPVFLTQDKSVQNWVEPIASSTVEFKTKSVGQPFDATLKPFYKTYNEHYSVYFDLFTPSEWQKKKDEYEAEKLRLAAIEKNTIDYFRIGEMQPERDHGLVATERSFVDDALGVKGREARAGHHFEFKMQVDPTVFNQLLVVYIGDDKDRKFDIFIDNNLFKTIDWKGGISNKFYYIEYDLPNEFIQNKSQISIKVEANYGKTTARIFGVRTLRR